ncbi:chaplin [Streptomyces sp. NPDC049813]|uniref:chaplin n=1 Tax=Streptomyces sp. NPDC049813 TaxID=3365597 RepID=UPI003791D77E
MRQALRIGVVAAAAATGFLSVPGAGAAVMSGAQEQTGGSPGVLSGNSVEAPVSVPVNVCGNSVDAVGALNPATGDHCAAKDASAVTSPDGGHARAASGYGDPDSTTATSAHDGDDGNGDEPGGYGDDAPAHPTEPRTPHSASSTSGSSGVLSGNSVQAPVDLGLNLCGNTVDVIGVGNPVFGNSCASEGGSTAGPTHPHGERPPARPDEPGTPPSDRALPVPGSDSQVEAAGLPRSVPAGEAAVDTEAPVAHEQLASTGVDERILAAAATGAGLLLGGGILYRRSATARR